ncbi:MAG: hypothetical protein ACD_64C00018G0001 [uncultured bacterium]|nr:MAG: hypothetical protein ACD_64C00018G0001 [uncultured bacterium]HLE76729.1 hypothetical protein [Candidatus Babeliales bacterium]
MNIKEISELYKEATGKLVGMFFGIYIGARVIPYLLGKDLIDSPMIPKTIDATALHVSIYLLTYIVISFFKAKEEPPMSLAEYEKIYGNIQDEGDTGLSDK